MSTTAQQRPTSTPPDPTGPQRDIWTRRLAIGLPVLVLLLIIVVANQIGGVLIARDLRNQYATSTQPWWRKAPRSARRLRSLHRHPPPSR